MSTEVRQSIADSRALYFSDFQPEDCSEDSVARRPSYVGLSHAVNGYTPYSAYSARPAEKKISPPIQIPVSPPATLDSVGLVLSQDQYHKSITEFEAVMRDLSNGSFDMGRPQRNTDMIDATGVPSKRHIISNGDNFFPKTHSRQIIDEGDKKSVEIVTKFHSDEEHSPTYRSSPSRQNLVQKQIERLYGDTLCQVTSPTSSDNGSPDKPERKISGGFFAKRFGITKMKDHSTRKVESSESQSPVEYKPLKVPKVFQLLRPEFREQLKQSSCKIEIPQETDRVKQERIIPIRRENGDKKSGENGESVVPVKVNGSLNNNNNKTPSSEERIIPIRRESGEIGISSTPKRPAGFAPKVNGFNSTNSAWASSLRNGSSSKAGAGDIKNQKQEVSNGSTGSNGSSATNGSKAGVVRKLSPLSPKHLVVAQSSEKPAPMPKPEHLKSPPLSPEPAASPSSPTPPLVSSSPGGDEGESKVGKPEEPAEITPAAPPTLETSQDRVQSDPNLNTPQSGNNGKQALDNSFEEFEGEEYPEEFYYDNPPCGLRERELLCPIMEEDNESTASGSIMNLANTSNNSAVIGSGYSTDDPLLITEQGEVQDGHYFIKVLENEIFKFEENICDFEEDLNGGSNIPEDVRDTILTVIGMAKLLMAQKLTQFRELCYKNINVSRDEDPFVPTCQDLAGFWDMVSIQVEQIHKRFDGLVELKRADWVVKKPEPVKNNKTVSKKTPSNKGKPKEKSEAAKARDEARKKMLEERKRMMKEKAKAQAGGEDGLILIM